MPSALLSNRDFYDVIQHAYAHEAEARQPYLDAIDAIVIELARTTNARTLLDIGCGDGRRLRRIIDRTGVAGVGVDISPRMVAATRELGIEAHVVDIADPGAGWPLEGRRFDLVTALWNVVGHITGTVDRQRALRTMRGSLDDAGRLVLDVNNRYNAAAYGWRAVVANRFNDRLGRGRTGDFVMRRTVDGTDVETVTHLFSVEEIDGLCRTAGLTPAEVRFVDYADGMVRREPWAGQICLIAAPEAQSSSPAR